MGLDSQAMDKNDALGVCIRGVYAGKLKYE
jgi:hypothetical protein